MSGRGGTETTMEEAAYRERVGPAGNGGAGGGGVGGYYREEGVDEEDVLDNAEMQQLNEEAERMKGLGNKHMASQEYTRAYNAYSAALQLSPVGPSSHVFLSNRAASLLSLKRYSAAAVDARRAVALAPTFGKAHARLGQALYFLKDYDGAVAAYEDAVKYEPDNAVTWTYLSKAKSKLAKQREKEERKALGEEVSVAASKDSTAAGGNSIATDPNASAAVVTGGLRSSSTRLVDVVGSEFKQSVVAESSPPKEVQTEPMVGKGKGGPAAGPTSPASPPVVAETLTQNDDDVADGEDPDYEEAVRLQHRATNFLSHKQYRSAVEEYSAALFLVPDDALLSPQLHIGRAHALNGLKRHESATNDARMAVGIDPQSAEAYSVLAKSLFYSKEYAAAIEAFEKSEKCLGPGESLSMFDAAYLEKAREALREEEASRGPEVEVQKKGKVIPKLKPPRFVPREDVVTSTPNLPPMPKAWPQQSPRSPDAFRVGPEREIVFFSESMGIKLNRGPDGIVRILSVTPVTPESPIAREGDIRVGDVIREAAGVDMRRPITNIMWGDTVALVKLAPRPIKIVVAEEESPRPPAVLEELAKAEESGSSSFTPVAALNGSGEGEDGGKGSESKNFIFPSPANGEEAVADSVAVAAERDAGSSPSEEAAQTADRGNGDVGEVLVAGDGDTAKSDDDEGLYEDFPRRDLDTDEEEEEAKTEQENEAEDSEVLPPTPQDIPRLNIGEDSGEYPDKDDSMNVEGGESVEPQSPPKDASSETDDGEQTAAEVAQLQTSSSQEELKALEGEILFEASNDNDPSAPYQGYSNDWWLKSTSTRSLVNSGPVTRLVHSKMIWQGDQYLSRTLALFRNPDVLMVLRAPKDAVEVRRLLNMPPDLDVVGKDGFLIAESVVELNTCKLRLSQLTTPTSFATLESDATASSSTSNLKRRTCFEVATPSETILLSAVVPKDGDTTKDVSYTDNRAYVETSVWEIAIATALHKAHAPVYAELSEDTSGFETDKAWKHMIVRGSIHSHVITGKIQNLERAIEIALTPEETNSKEPKKELTREEKSRILDERDDSGLTALMYACTRRLSAAVSILVNAGANCTIPTPRDLKTPCHLTAECLDEKSLSTILSATYPARPDPNALCAAGRTPMYLAAVEGTTVGGGSDPVALGCCISALEAWGAQMFVHDDEEKRLPLPHPIACTALHWKAAELDVLFSHINYFYPLTDETTDDGVDSASLSIGAKMHYPVHAAFIALRKKIKLVKADGLNHGFEQPEVVGFFVSTLETLLKHGFDPNERLDRMELRDDAFAVELNELFGFTPLQILALAALDTQQLSSDGDDKEGNQDESDGTKSRPISSATLDGIMSCISQSADLLVRNGARISISAPPASRKKESVAKSVTTPLKAPRLSKLTLGRGGSENSNPDSEHEVSDTSTDHSTLKIEGNETMLRLLGGEDELNQARAKWVEAKTVRGSERIVLNEEVPKEEALGDSNSCTICWKAFGTVTNRRHTCRVTKRYVCDECSSKRMVVSGVEHRISDGPFLMAQVEEEVADEEDQKVFEEERQQRRERLKKEQAARRASAEQPKDEDAAKQELFGGALVKNMKTLFMGEEEEDEGDKLESVAAKLSATRNAFNERGERLNSLAEKTSALKDASRDFASMAKELNKKQQQRGMFW